MPSSTIWLKIGNADVRVYKQKVGNALMIKEPQLRKQVDGESVRDERIVSGCRWEQIGTGDVLTTETILKNSKGEVIPVAQGQCILEHYKSYVLNIKGEQVDKKKVQYFIVNPDGSTGDQVAPYPPTERIRVVDSPSEVSEQGDGYWVSSTVLGEFLIHEEYELPAADPRNDMKLFKEAEEAAKRDEIVVTTFSNGGFTQRILSKGCMPWRNIRGILCVSRASVQGRKVRVGAEDQRQEG